MENRVIILYNRDIAIAKLTEESDGKYSFIIDEEALKAAAEQGCPVELLGPKRGVRRDTIPPIFGEFQISNGRKELLNELGIVKGDGYFDRLYKRAVKSDEFPKRDFWIGIEKAGKKDY